MPTVQSKLSPITTTCIEYVHPWTDSCSVATAGLIIQSALDSLRIYSAVYTLSLLMRRRWPTWTVLRKTLLGILQSSAFLTTSAFTYVLYLCLIRRFAGNFNFYSVSYIPAFMSALCAILIERPSRRGLLTLYVSNVATETLWNMAHSRGYVRNIPYGQVLLFGTSITMLLYFFRRGLHHTQKDSLFDIIRFVLGSSEEYRSHSPNAESQPQTSPQPTTSGGGGRPVSPLVEPFRGIPPNTANVFDIARLVDAYQQLLRTVKCNMPRHSSCPHQHSCAFYTIDGGAKLFSIGVGVQITLKLLFQVNHIVRKPALLKKVLFNRDTLKLGLFLGGFSAFFRGTSCLMRHITGIDDPIHAVPAGLVASVAFTQYPDTTIALYIMWKTLQISYNAAVNKGWAPAVPGFGVLLYCATTATLFHAAIMEPLNLRPSYWKFLHSLSGGRVAAMDRKPLDVWGLDTTRCLQEVLKKTRTDMHVKFSL